MKTAALQKQQIILSIKVKCRTIDFVVNILSYNYSKRRPKCERNEIVLSKHMISFFGVSSRCFQIQFWHELSLALVRNARVLLVTKQA
jgi:hypothetical protein